jgi:DNA-binding GntR family transcriptional regulator
MSARMSIRTVAAHEEHGMLVAALERGDVNAAEAVVRMHLANPASALR